MITIRRTAALSLCLAGVAACAMSSAATPSAPRPSAAPATATALVRDASGKELGTLTLTSMSTGIAVVGRLTGLPPGRHAIHLHAVGRCEPPAFTSAGGHWNPFGREHGLRNPRGPHAGDLPTILVDTDGSARVDGLTLGGSLTGRDALLDADGAAVVVHAGADDDMSDPAGNSGARVACGIVTPA